MAGCGDEVAATHTTSVFVILPAIGKTRTARVFNVAVGIKIVISPLANHKMPWSTRIFYPLQGIMEVERQFTTPAKEVGKE
jgi:hypothetical protein